MEDSVNHVSTNSWVSATYSSQIACLSAMTAAEDSLKTKRKNPRGYTRGSPPFKKRKKERKKKRLYTSEYKMEMTRYINEEFPEDLLEKAQSIVEEHGCYDREGELIMEIDSYNIRTLSAIDKVIDTWIARKKARSVPVHVMSSSESEFDCGDDDDNDDYDTGTCTGTRPTMTHEHTCTTTVKKTIIETTRQERCLSKF